MKLLLTEPIFLIDIAFDGNVNKWRVYSKYSMRAFFDEWI